MMSKTKLPCLSPVTTKTSLLILDLSLKRRQCGYAWNFVEVISANAWWCVESHASSGPIGGSVADVYNNTHRPIPEDAIAHITQCSLAGLEYLHQAHLVHRDIKVSPQSASPEQRTYAMAHLAASRGNIHNPSSSQIEVLVSPSRAGTSS